MSSNKISFRGKAKIVNEDYVLKRKNKNIKYLYDYLSSRDFYNYPELIDEEEDFYKFRYIVSKNITSYKDVLSLMGKLHNKTITLKEVSEEDISKIYNKINENIKYLENYYTNLISNIETKEYFSPSEYVLARNIGIVFSSLSYSKKTLDKWKEYISKKYQTRVAIIHNNLSNEHVIDNNIISFDKYIKDFVVLDIYKYFKNEKDDINILNNISIYEEENKLNYEENLLLNVLISLPNKVKFTSSELDNTVNIRKIINSVYDIEKFIKNRDVSEGK